MLAFLATRIGDEVLITPQQRALVVASEALNPVPPEILAEQQSIITVSADPTAGGPNILVAQQAILNELAAMMSVRTRRTSRHSWPGRPKAPTRTC